MPQRGYFMELGNSISETTNNFLVLGNDAETGCPILRLGNDNNEMHLEGHFSISHVQSELRRLGMIKQTINFFAPDGTIYSA